MGLEDELRGVRLVYCDSDVEALERLRKVQHPGTVELWRNDQCLQRRSREARRDPPPNTVWDGVAALAGTVLDRPEV